MKNYAVNEKLNEKHNGLCCHLLVGRLIVDNVPFVFLN